MQPPSPRWAAASGTLSCGWRPAASSATQRRYHPAANIFMVTWKYFLDAAADGKL